MKWGGAGLTVLLLVAWIGSGWFDFARLAKSGQVSRVGGGCFTTYPFPPVPIDDSSWVWSKRSAFSLDWRFRWSRSGRFYQGQVPLWLPALLALLATATAWRTDAKYLRRTRAGLCPACGYDRAGLVAGAVCPECGKQPEAR